MLRGILVGLFAAVLAFGWLIGPPAADAQTQPVINGITSNRCKNDAVSRCTTDCADVGQCIFGCEIGGINNVDTCESSCTGLGAPCLNSCFGTIQSMHVCMLPRVNGVVSGLGAGRSVVLQNNGADDLTVGADGAFAFPISVIENTAYAVTVLNQPQGQLCSVANGSGLAPAYAVTGVAVSCINTVPMLSNWRMPLLVGLLLIGGLVLLSPILARRGP